MMRLVGVLALLLHAATAAEPRPTLQEWTEKQGNATKAKEAVAAKEAKMAAVAKVVTMLTDLQNQVLAEGEKEAASYNKFSCFCKDTTAEKTSAISTGYDNKAALTATINKLAAKRDDLDAAVAGLLADIKAAEKAMKDAEEKRAAELAVYAKNAEDLSGALVGLEGAIKTLKASKTPSLMQFKEVANTVRTAALLADALGLDGNAVKNTVTMFLQQDPAPENEVPMEDYKFHSDGIIATLEKLLADFQDEKTELDKAEVKAVAAHESFMQDQMDVVKQKTKEMEDAKKMKAKTVEEISSNSQELTVVAATLLDDQEYLKDLSKMCSDKAKTWDQRSKVRALELSTLTQTIGILKSTVSEKTTAKTARFNQMAVSLQKAAMMAKDPELMNEVEAEAEAAENADSPLAFVQAGSKKGFLAAAAPHNPAADFSDARSQVVDLLRKEGVNLKSALLTSLASQISADPFAKVKKLIQELIERLLTEASNEANQKGWCDKAISDAEQKREYAATEINELNSEMATLEAVIDKLTEQLDVLSKEIKELEDKQAEATKLRKEEKAENEATVLEAQEGLKAVNMAMDILDKFYKTMNKEAVELSLVQGPADDAPEQTFAIGEAYKGAQSESGGIIGMLEVISSDFKRTISETEKAEEQAEDAYLEFMTETGKSLAEKKTAEAQYTKEKHDAEDKFSSAEDNMKAQTEILLTSIKELMELKPACIDTGMSYAERVARREDEIAALKKALCILQNYGEFGPGGAADKCS
jgi:uncharacterized coiled-coil protein SlyX